MRPGGSALMRAILAAFLVACSSGGPSSPPVEQQGNGGAGTFPQEPLATGTSDGGLRLEIRTAPSQPPPRGTCTIELALLGSPTDGIDVSVVPWMDAMGHGTSVKPTVTAVGGGKYVITNVSLFMPGTWSLRFAFSGPVNDKATLTFDVP
jgi:hypothetical protein